MKINRTLSFLAIILFLLWTPLSLSAFDFGIGINNKTVLQNDSGKSKPLTIEEKVLINLQFDHFFNDYYQFYVRGHLELGTEFHHKQNQYLFYPTGDLDRFFISGKIIPNNDILNYVSFQAGRQFFSDFSTQLAHLLIDGISLNLGFDGAELSMMAGYTGLVYRWTNPIKMSAADVYQTQQWSGHFSNPYSQIAKSYNRYAEIHTSPRFLSALALKIPALIKGQTLYLECLAQADLWNFFSSQMATADLTTRNRYSPIHTFYTGGGLEGYINRYFSYHLFSYFGTGTVYNYQADSKAVGGFSYQPKLITSGMVGFDLEAFIKEALYSHLLLNFRYASGQKGSIDYYDLQSTEKFYTRFVPINNKRENIIFNPILSNLMTIGLNYSFKPFSSFDNPYAKTILVEMDLKTFLRASESPISYQNHMTNNYKDWYIGTELDFLLNWLTLSDFNLFTSLGVFFPNKKLFRSGEDKPKLEAELNFSFSI